MIAVDFHVHSIFSHCGLHTILELLDQARKIGIKGFAVTDHGPTLGGRLNSVFFERFVSPDPNIRIFRGIECNVLDNNGNVDIPSEYIQYCEVILVGLHQNIDKGLPPHVYTSMLLAALRRNPAIDIVSHPNDQNYPINYKELARFAAKTGAALEVNNSKIRLSRSSKEQLLELLSVCKEEGCRVAVNSDTHAIHELGDDSDVSPIIMQARFPEELIVNRTTETAFNFVEQRRTFKH